MVLRRLIELRLERRAVCFGGNPVVHSRISRFVGFDRASCRQNGDGRGERERGPHYSTVGHASNVSGTFTASPGCTLFVKSSQTLRRPILVMVPKYRIPSWIASTVM